MIKKIAQWLMVWIALSINPIAIAGLVGVAADMSFDAYMQPAEWGRGARVFAAIWIICIGVLSAAISIHDHREQNK